MKKTFKIKMITVMALAMCLSLVLGFTIVSRPSAKVSATTPTTFEMLGMSIRYSAADGDDGIRFGVKLDLATYNALKNDDNARAGILVTPSDQISGGSLSLSTAALSHAQYGILYKGGDGGYNYWSVDGDYATGIVYLHGFPTESYNRPITAVAYIDWDNDGTDMNHSDTVEISMADVALDVTTDYAGSNTYGTTEAQAEKLDAYLLNYDVKFLDAYGNVSTQSVKFGSELEVADDPATRTGYTFNGWYEKNGESAYAATATDFNATNAKKVKYARTFKPGFNTNGTIFEKPAILKTLGGRSQGVNSVDADDFEWHAKGDYIFADTGVSKAEGFTITATFIPESGAEYSFAITDDLENGRGRITYRMSNNKFYFYNYTSGEYGGVSWNWYDSKEAITNSASALVADTPATMSFVYSVDAFIVYINGVRACSFVDTDSLQSNYGSTMTVADLVGDGDTVYLGFGAYNGPDEGTLITDWGFSTGVSDSVANMLADLRAACFTNDNGYNYNNPQFEVQATFKQSASGILGFMFRQAEWGRWCTFGYNTETGKFGYYRFGLTSSKREFTMSNNAYNGSTDNTIKVVYYGDRVLDVYINGTKMKFTDSRGGNDGSFYLGWAWTGSADSDKPFAWWGDISISTRKDMRVGVSHADAYNFSVNRIFVPYDESPVANFASDLSNGVFTNNNGTNNNNPQFEVQATFAYNAAIDHYGFKFQQVGNGTSTVFAYDATNGYFGYYKNGNKASDWREFRITNYSKDTFTANAQNTIKVVYYGDRVLDVYINGTKIIFATDGDDCQRGGNSGSFYLGWNCVATSSAHGSQTNSDSAKPFVWWGTSTVDSRATLNVSAYQFTGNTGKGDEGVSDFSLTITRAYS